MGGSWNAEQAECRMPNEFSGGMLTGWNADCQISSGMPNTGVSRNKSVVGA